VAEVVDQETLLLNLVEQVEQVVEEQEMVLPLDQLPHQKE
jgi:hypothetical protein